MASKDQLIKEKVDHSGIFDFPALYGYVHSWLKNEDYGVVEEKYSEKVSGNERGIVIEWKAAKQISDYFKFEIGLKWEVTITDVEVEIDGKKKKSNKGKVTIEIKGTLVTDPESKWDSTPFYRFIKDTYTKYVIPSRVENTQMKLMADVRDLKEEVKSFLSLSGKR